MVEEYAPLVHRIARKMVARLPPNVEIDDLKSVGVIGLIDALEKYEPGRGSFRAYAEIRIRGAILDELRRLDWVPRSVRALNTQMEGARRTLSASLGRTPSEAEMAEALNCTVPELYEQSERARAMTVVSYEGLGTQSEDGRDFLEALADPDAIDPEDHSHSKARQAVLLEGFRALDERPRLVLSLYYFEDMSLREIGTILGVTESRISQIHSGAVRQLRPILEDLIEQ